MSLWNKLFKFTPKKKPEDTPTEVSKTKDAVDKVIARKEAMVEESKDLAGVDISKELPDAGNYFFSKASLRRLQTCHPDIQRLCNEAIKYIDFGITEGSRHEAKQNEYFASGASKVKYPNSFHNTLNKHVKEEYRPEGSDNGLCSLAVDLVPTPLDWEDLDRFVELARIIKICAENLEIPIDWGYDMWQWDYPHFQLTSYRTW